MRKVTLAQKGHLLTAQNRQKALERGLLGRLSWNLKIGLVGYGFGLYMLLIRLLAGNVGFYLIWDLIASKSEMETTMGGNN